MKACPHCHIYKGLWSPMTMNDNGQFVCRIDVAHRFTRDVDGNFHPIRGN